MNRGPSSEIEHRGNRWIGAGGAFGLAGAVGAVVLPVTLVEASRYSPGGIATASNSLVAWSSWFFLVGAVLLFLSFFSYRWGYSVLRRVDPSYWAASALCIVGTSGLLLLIVAAAFATGNAGGLLVCVKGPFGQLYSCIHGQTPLGAYTGIVGLWLAWVGGIGIVVGLFQAGGRFLSALYAGGAACYLVTIVLLVGPLAGAFYTFPYVEQLLLIVPTFLVLGPLLVLLARPTYLRATSPLGASDGR